MRDERGVRTERGTLSLRDGQLRVRTTPRGVLDGIRVKKWREAGAKRRGLFLLTVLTTGWGIRGVVSTTLGGGPDELLPYALLVSGLACVIFAFLGDLRRRNVTIPLRAIERVERKADDPTLRVTHAESGDAETTEIELLSESNVERATERLRYKGVRVSGPASDRSSAADERRERSKATNRRER